MPDDLDLQRYRHLPNDAIVPGESTPPAVVVRITDLYAALLADAQTEGTRRSRIEAVRAFQRYLHAETPLEAIALFLGSGRGPANAIALGFRNHEKFRGLTAATINVRQAALRRLVRLANRFDVIGFGVEIDDLKNHCHADRRGPRPEGWRAIWGIAVSWGETPRGCQTRALIRLLHDGALRRMEAVTLDVEHVDLSRPGVFILSKGHGAAREWVTTNAPTTRAIREWLQVRGSDPGPLFLCQPSRPTAWRPFAPRVAYWRSEGRSNAAVAVLLNEEGIPSPDGRPWNAALVGGLFRQTPPCYLSFVPFVEQLVREGADNPEIARRLNETGQRKQKGKLWSSQAVCDIFLTAKIRNPERYPGEHVDPGPTRMHDLFVNRLIDKLAREAHLGKVRPHGLRHAGVTRALHLTNGDIRKTQRFARHADPKTTMRYDDDRTDMAGEVSELIGEDF